MVWINNALHPLKHIAWRHLDINGIKQRLPLPRLAASLDLSGEDP